MLKHLGISGIDPEKQLRRSRGGLVNWLTARRLFLPQNAINKCFALIARYYENEDEFSQDLVFSLLDRQIGVIPIHADDLTTVKEGIDAFIDQAIPAPTDR